MPNALQGPRRRLRNRLRNVGEKVKRRLHAVLHRRRDAEYDAEMNTYCPPINQQTIEKHTTLIHYLPDINHPEQGQQTDVMDILEDRLKSMRDSRVAKWTRKCILDVLLSVHEDDEKVAAQLVDLLGIDEVALVAELVGQKEIVLAALCVKAQYRCSGSGSGGGSGSGSGSDRDSDEDDSHDQAQQQPALTTTTTTALKHPLRVIPNNRTTCAICLDDFVSARESPQNAETLRLLPCSHILHKQCIDEWLTEVSARCPLCFKSVLVGDVKAVV